MKNHPNATVAATSGGVGVIIVWLLSLAGVHMPAEVGAAVSTIAATVALLIGRRGIRGIARIIWRGGA